MHWIPPNKPGRSRPAQAARRRPWPRAACGGKAAVGLTLLQAIVACFSAVALMSERAVADPLVDGSQILARYTTAAAAPDATRGQPLAVVATVHFPRATVTTVGDALNHLLVRTGYTLIPAEQLDPLAARLLKLDLPESQRALGPYRVDAMLHVLLGEGWTLQVDNLQRRIGFGPAAAAAAEVAAPAAVTASAERGQP